MTPTDNNRFSLHRLDRVWSFYEPGTRRYLLLTALATVVAYLMSMVANATMSLDLFSISSLVVTVPFYFGASAFIFYHDRTLTCQLPATAAEKFVFMTLFCYVVVPLTIFIVWTGIDSIACLCGVKTITLETVKQLLINELDIYNSSALVTAIYDMQHQWMRLFMDLLPTTVFFYIVVATSKQRFMKAFAGVIVTNISVGLACGIYTAVVMISHLIEIDGEISASILTGLIIECATNAMLASVFISPLLSCIGLYLVWRKIKRFQI